MNTAAETIASADDIAVLRRFAAAGDPRAFEVIATRYGGMVLATCRRVLGRDADAEDAAQETFLKLARRAGTVRANAGAWLHATAVRTALDLKRRQGVRDRVEQGAAPAASAGDDERAWREIEPLVDAALAQLPEDDRDLIVARFLAGRSQSELAREAGVNPGTMHRRIDRALERLRERLRAGGVTIAAAGAFSAVMAHAAAPDAAQLAQGLAKIGLAGLTTTPSAVSTAKVASAAVIGVIAIGTLGAAWLALGGGHQNAAAPPPTVTPSAPASAGRPVRWPGGEGPRFALTAFKIDWGVDSSMSFDGRSMRLNVARDATGRPLGMDLTLDARDDAADPPRLRMRVRSIDPGQPALPQEMVGTVLDIACDLDARGRLTMSTIVPTPDGPQDQTWMGVRVEAPAPGRPGHDDPLAGTWHELQPWDLRLSKDAISIVSGDWKVHVFRVLEREDAGDHTRVQAFCTDSMDQRLVGERLKILLREDDGGGYTLVYHNHDHPRLNEWPATFDVRPGDGLQRLTWRKDQP